MSYVQDAIKVVTGDRTDSYGNPKADFEGCALIWNGILQHKLHAPITAQDVPLLMIGLKLRRQAYQHKDDNWVDIHGYALCAEWMATGIKPEGKEAQP